MDYPINCRHSGYTPVLVVLDSTANSKLSELEQAFLSQGGEVYIGENVWQHLASLAGPTMSNFLAKYVRGPIDELIREATDELPEFVARMEDGNISISIGGEVLHVDRRPEAIGDEEPDQLPDDVSDNLPGS